MNQAQVAKANLYVERQRRDQILGGACDRRLPVLLTRYGGSGWMAYRSRFTACCLDAGSIYIERPRGEESGGTADLSVGEQIGISFRRGRTKCLFTTVITGCEPMVDSSTPNVDTITLRWPEELQEMQRRLYERVNPPQGQAIDASYWHTTANPGQPADAQHGVLENLSAGGLSILVDHLPALNIGDVVGCAFRPRAGTEPLEFEARLRHIGRPGGRRWSLGFQFLGLESSTEGQCRLAQLATLVSWFRRSRTPVGRRHLPG